MKVLQVITSLNTGGAEKLILDSVPLYQKKGIAMDVLCLNNNETPFWRKLREKSNGNISGLSKGSVYNPLLIFLIIPFLKKYDLLHVHLFPALYWVVLAKWISFSRTKIIYTEHSTNNNRRKYLFFKLIDRLIYSGLSKIITIADEVDSNIKLHLGYHKEKFQVINNGVDINSFSKATPLLKTVFFNEKDFLLIQVSSFREQKDQITLIKALEFLPNSIKLLLVGDGPLIKENKDLVKKLHLQNRVKFLGIRTDVPKLLKTSDIVVLSSVYEGLSLSSIEGMATRPFIASDVPGLREIVKNHGLLFEKGNSKELAQLILSLYENKDFYHKIAHQCLERAKEFDIAKMINKYIEVYETTTLSKNMKTQ